MLDDPDCELDKVTRLVQAEPLLATKVVAVANSVVFNRSGKRVTDVRSAISLLGFNIVRNLATAILTRQLAGKAANSEVVTQLWKHSAYVASLAQVIARRVTKQNPDTAMFAGMIHEISWFYLLSREKDFPGLTDGNFASSWVRDEDLGDETEIECEIKIGTAILKALAVPAPVVEVLLACGKDIWLIHRRRSAIPCCLPISYPQSVHRLYCRQMKPARTSEQKWIH